MKLSTDLVLAGLGESCRNVLSVLWFNDAVSRPVNEERRNLDLGKVGLDVLPHLKQNERWGESLHTHLQTAGQWPGP